MIHQFSLEGRFAIVTGAAGWLGRPIAEALADAGAHVHLVGRDATKVEALAQELASRGRLATSESLDLRNMRAIAEFGSRIRDHTETIDIIINNAYSGTIADIHSADPGQYQDSYLTCVTAAAEMVRSCMPSLEVAAKKNSYASIVNIASMYGIVSPDPYIYEDSGMNNPPFYGAAKAGLIQYTRYAAVHLASRGIRVNSVSPGPFPQAHVKRDHPDFARRLSKKIPMGRYGNPHEIAGPVLFLASPASSFVTGINMPVDGGWTAW